jgi:N-acetylglucosamine kinase-like BadF-type ATPase
VTRILGLDAGGTGSRAVVVQDGDVVSRHELGPMNVLLHRDSVQRLAELIHATGVDAAGLGLAGVQAEADARKVTMALRELTAVPVAVTDDSEIALLGAFDGAPGIIVIAGTGSIACGRGSDGSSARAGGYGFLLGDEGAGYWIGRECIRTALRARDGLGPRSAIDEVVQSVFGGDLNNAIRLVHQSPRDRLLMSQLVPLIAGLDDDVARDILARAADQLAALADGLRARLGALPVAMAGGIFRIAAVRGRFVERTGAVPPAQAPEIGAVRYAQLTLPKEIACP